VGLRKQEKGYQVEDCDEGTLGNLEGGRERSRKMGQEDNAYQKWETESEYNEQVVGIPPKVFRAANTIPGRRAPAQEKRELVRERDGVERLFKLARSQKAQDRGFLTKSDIGKKRSQAKENGKIAEEEGNTDFLGNV